MGECIIDELYENKAILKINYLAVTQRIDFNERKRGSRETSQEAITSEVRGNNALGQGIGIGKVEK